MHKAATRASMRNTESGFVMMSFGMGDLGSDCQCVMMDLGRAGVTQW